MIQPATPRDPTRASLLWRLARDPEQTTWEDFVLHYGDLIRFYCSRQGLPLVDCDELVQEVFQALLKRLPRFRYDARKGGFRAYLWRVVYNHALALRRFPAHSGWPGKALAGCIDLLPSGEDPDEVWEEEWRRHHVRRAYRQVSREFSQRSKEVFRLHVLDGLPVDEVASRTGCSAEVVYQSKSRILRRLREVITAQIDAEE